MSKRLDNSTTDGKLLLQSLTKGSQYDVYIVASEWYYDACTRQEHQCEHEVRKLSELKKTTEQQKGSNKHSVQCVYILESDRIQCSPHNSNSLNTNFQLFRINRHFPTIIQYIILLRKKLSILKCLFK